MHADGTATPIAAPHTMQTDRSSSGGSSLSISSAPDHVLHQAERAVSMRLLPPLLLLVVISYLDRTALSFASIQMSDDLKLSSSMYGLGSGAFFLAYAVGQIPSNFLLLRFGGPTWLAFICVVWGIAASSTALVRGPVSFVLLRMLLGLAESGGFPGVWYYISCWYARDRTTVPYTVIETGITVSQVVAAPIAAGLLLLDGKLGLKGWQWLFMLEGVPAVLLGCFIGFWLPKSIQTASFLSEQQRLALLKATSHVCKADSAADPEDVSSCAAPAGPVSDTDSSVDVAIEVAPPECGKDLEAAQLLHAGLSPTAKAAADSARQGAATPAGGLLQRRSSLQGLVSGGGYSSGRGGYSSLGAQAAPPSAWQQLRAVVRNRAVLYAGSWRILHDIPGNGVLYWTPKIVQALLLAAAVSPAQHGGSSGPSSPGVGVVLFSAIPYAAASLVHVLNAWHSQRVKENKLHIAYTWAVGAVALMVLPFAASGALSGGSSSGAAGSSVGAASAAAAFVVLTIAHVGVNGANGLQTGLVAGCLSAEEKALGLACYNTIACLGSFLGPLLIGVLHDATHGYSVAMWVLGCSLAAAAFMVYRFKGSAIYRC